MNHSCSNTIILWSTFIYFTPHHPSITPHPGYSRVHVFQSCIFMMIITTICYSHVYTDGTLAPPLATIVRKKHQHVCHKSVHNHFHSFPKKNFSPSSETKKKTLPTRQKRGVPWKSLTYSKSFLVASRWRYKFDSLAIVLLYLAGMRVGSDEKIIKDYRRRFNFSTHPSKGWTGNMCSFYSNPCIMLHFGTNQWILECEPVELQSNLVDGVSFWLNTHSLTNTSRQSWNRTQSRRIEYKDLMEKVKIY